MAPTIAFGAHNRDHQVQQQMPAEQNCSGQREDVHRACGHPWLISQEASGEADAARDQVRPKRGQAEGEQGPEHRQPAGQGDGLPEHQCGGGGAGRPLGVREKDWDGPGQGEGKCREGDRGADHMDSVVVEEAPQRLCFLGTDAPDEAFEYGGPVVGCSEDLVHEGGHVLLPGGRR